MSMKAVCAIVCLAGMPLVSMGQNRLSPGEHLAHLNGVNLWYKISGHEQSGQAPVLL